MEGNKDPWFVVDGLMTTVVSVPIQAKDAEDAKRLVKKGEYDPYASQVKSVKSFQILKAVHVGERNPILPHRPNTSTGED